MSTFLTVLYTILIFGVIITIHEFGHFIVAKLGKIKVNEFSVGMGYKIFSKTKGETLYSLRLFPIGGYVSMEGEDESSNDKRAFCKKPIYIRIAVLIAGATLNLILGLIILFSVNMAKPYLSTNTVVAFNENSLSSSTGLKVGDEIVAINGQKAFISNDIIFELLRDNDAKIDIDVIRNGQYQSLKGVEFNKSTLSNGQEALDIDFKVSSEKNSFIKSVKYSFMESFSMVKMVLFSLFDLLTGKVALSQLSGPIGVAGVIGEAASIGFMQILSIAAFLTINVGIFNLLPLPALDGGRVVFLFVEAIRRKPIKPETEGYIHSIGFGLLILLMIFVTFQDIIKIF